MDVLFQPRKRTCSSSTGPASMSISGGNLLVADGGADVALIELSSAPPARGTWNSPGGMPLVPPQRHRNSPPFRRCQKICLKTAPTPLRRWRTSVVDRQLEAGVTEPGSSGSPLLIRITASLGSSTVGRLRVPAASTTEPMTHGRFNVS